MKKDAAWKFALEWIESWNARDFNRILAHYADDLHYSSPIVLERGLGADGIIRERATLRDYIGVGLAKNPNLRFNLREVLLGAQGMTLYYDNARGGRTAEYIEFDADGRISRVVACYST